MGKTGSNRSQAPIGRMQRGGNKGNGKGNGKGQWVFQPSGGGGGGRGGGNDALVGALKQALAGGRRGGNNNALVGALKQALSSSGSGGGGGKSSGKGSFAKRQQQQQQGDSRNRVQKTIHKDQKKTFKVDTSGGEVGEFIGTIKRFNERTKYGFIECDEAGQGDIFLHGDQKKGYKEGQTVKFTCVLNKDDKPVAINLKSGISGQGDGRNRVQKTNVKVEKGRNRVQKTNVKEEKKTFKVDTSGGEVGEFIGTIKRFNERTRYGFIECDEAGQGDIFLHGDQKKGYKEGQTVRFTCVLNKDDKPVAINLKSGLN